MKIRALSRASAPLKRGDIISLKSVKGFDKTTTLGLY